MHFETRLLSQNVILLIFLIDRLLIHLITPVMIRIVTTTAEAIIPIIEYTNRGFL